MYTCFVYTLIIYVIFFYMYDSFICTFFVYKCFFYKFTSTKHFARAYMYAYLSNIITLTCILL